MNDIKVGDYVDCEVAKIVDYGAFVKLTSGLKGLIHISQVADTYVKDINEHLQVGQKLKARLVKIDSDGRIDLSLKSQAEQNKDQDNFRFAAFEDKLKKFLKER